MSWEGAIHSQRQLDEIIRLRGELERAIQRIQQLESKLGEVDRDFMKHESMDSTSPLIKVSEASRSILLEKPSATYDKIKRQVFPAGVVVKLGERSYRFHRQKLMEWIENGGKVAA